MNIRAQSILDSLSVALAELEKANRHNAIGDDFKKSDPKIRQLHALDDYAWQVVDTVKGSK